MLLDKFISFIYSNNTTHSISMFSALQSSLCFLILQILSSRALHILLLLKNQFCRLGSNLLTAVHLNSNQHAYPTNPSNFCLRNPMDKSKASFSDTRVDSSTIHASRKESRDLTILNPAANLDVFNDLQTCIFIGDSDLSCENINNRTSLNFEASYKPCVAGKMAGISLHLCFIMSLLNCDTKTQNLSISFCTSSVIKCLHVKIIVDV